MLAAALLTVAVLNPTAVPARVLNRAERAIEQQVNTSVHAHWGTPRIAFTTGPAQISINFDTTQRQLVRACNGEQVQGCHWVSNNPGIEVQTDQDPSTWTSALDHEIIETLVDPNTTGVEVCDPVEYNTYQRDGVTLSDFAWPSYFDSLSFGPLDQMRQLVRRPTEYGHPMHGF